MSKCEITFKNNIPVVKTYPILMTELMVYTNNNIPQALDLYGITLTDDFIDLNISPTLENILAFNNQDNILNSKQLTKENRNDILNISLVDTEVTDFKKDFLETFTVNGVFGFNVDNIKKSQLFSEIDITELDNIENIYKIKELYYKLSNTSEEFSTIKTDLIIGEGLFNKNNPDIILSEIYKNYVGLITKKQILDKANEIGDYILLNNPELIKKVLIEVRNKQEIPLYETDEYSGDLVAKTDSTYTRLEQTVDISLNYTSLRSQVEFIKTIPIEYFATSPELIEKYFDNIKKQSYDVGIDLLNIDEIFYSKTVNELLDFLDSYYNFLSDLENLNGESLKDSILDFSETYDRFFNKKNSEIKDVVDKIGREGEFIKLETNRSEYKLFTENGLLKIDNNIYQKIDNNISLQQLYNVLLENDFLLPKDTLSVKNTPLNKDILLEDLDKFISNKAQEYQTDYSVAENLKKIAAYKVLLSINTKYVTVENGVSSNIDIDNFIIDFNKEIIKNKKLSDIFYISNRGIESRYNIGQYTYNFVKNELGTEMFNSLVSYSKLSGNDSLKYFSNMSPTDVILNRRDFYANNLHELDSFQGKYIEKGDLLYVKNNINDFIKVKNSLYEKVDTNVYAKVNVSDRYMNYNLKKPYYQKTNFDEIVDNKGDKIKIKETKEINNNQIKFC